MRIFRQRIRFYMKSGQKRRKHNTGLCRSRRWLRRRRLILQALDVDFAPGTGRQKDQLLGPRPTRLASSGASSYGLVLPTCRRLLPPMTLFMFSPATSSSLPLLSLPAWVVNKNKASRK